MNYFELYNIPTSLVVDANDIKKKYYELSRKFHPDFFSNATEEERAEVLEKSSAVNKAFKVFTNEDELIKYVLQLKNLLAEEEKYNLPNNFLMEMLELNEALMDAKMEDDTEKIENIKSQIINLKSIIYEPIKTIIENYKENITTEKELLQIKEYYFKKKYLTRILDGIK
ncbi:MAG: DnaJ domain-containing protein [Bacteroidetes bacterium]|nr:DnaJ domain-containing protein [Bacteroidota bacterium]MBS1650048.1 DnaJ domain-containing protein [Bacteroidota bacterium]